VDYYAIASNVAQARAPIESTCTYESGSFSTTACAQGAMAPCSRERCSLLHDLFVEDAGFPVQCEGEEVLP
jgi:hypothetical protein